MNYTIDFYKYRCVTRHQLHVWYSFITGRCENIRSIICSSFFQYLICSSSFVVYQFMSVRYLELRDPSMLPCTNIYSTRWHRFHSLEVSIWLWQSLLKGKFSFKIYEFCIPIIWKFNASEIIMIFILIVYIGTLLSASHIDIVS